MPFVFMALWFRGFLCLRLDGFGLHRLSLSGSWLPNLAMQSQHILLEPWLCASGLLIDASSSSSSGKTHEFTGSQGVTGSWGPEGGFVKRVPAT